MEEQLQNPISYYRVAFHCQLSTSSNKKRVAFVDTSKINSLTKHILFLLISLVFAFFVFLPAHAVSLGAGNSVEEQPSYTQTVHVTVPKNGQAAAIPFTSNGLSPLLIVSVQINGQEPLPFIVDTGTNAPVVIEKWAAEKLKLVSSRTSITHASSSKRLSLISLQSLLLKSTTPDSNIEYTTVPAVVKDIGLFRLGSPRVAGLLGLPLFFKFMMQFDSSQHLIFVSQHLDLSQIEPSAAYLRLVQPSETSVQYFVAWPAQSSNTVSSVTDGEGYRHTLSTVTTDTYNLLLDTGATWSCLPGTILSLLHPIGMSISQQFTAGTPSEVTMALIPDLNVAGYLVSDLYVSRSSPGSDIASISTFGMDILRQFRVTFDFPDKQLILDRFGQNAPTGIPGETGIWVEKRGANFLVANIQPGSPAAKTSLHSGDQITRIDNQSLAGYTKQMTQKLLDGTAGTAVTLRVGSRSQTQVSLPRISIYDPSLYPLCGFLAIQNPADQTIVVGHILCASPAWIAGLRPFDVLVSVNGIHIQSSKQVEDLLQSWPQKIFAFTVRRNCTIQSFTLPSPSSSRSLAN